jgi:hypothetical protein
MKRLSILFFTLSLTTFAVQAQTTTFGFKAGANQNIFYLKEDGGTGGEGYSFAKPGFHVGGIADIAFNSNFSIQPQLLLVSKGGNFGSGDSKIKFDFLTIDLPINFLYNYNGFFIGGGPNLSYGLSGKLKQEGDPDQDLYEEGTVIGTGTFKRFEVGANVLLGYRLPSGLTFSANYTPGLTDSFDETGADEIKSNNTFFGFSVGYIFGAKTSKK